MQRARCREKRVGRRDQLVGAGSGALLVMHNFYKLLSMASEDEIRYDVEIRVEPQISRQECLEIVCRMMIIYGEVKKISICLNKTPYLDGSVFVEFYDAAAARKALEVYNKTTITNLKKDGFFDIIAPSCTWWFYQLNWVVELCNDNNTNRGENITKLLQDIAYTKRWSDTMKTRITVEVFPFDSLNQLTCKKRGCEGGKRCHSLHLKCTKELYRKCSYQKERKKVIKKLEDIRSFNRRVELEILNWMAFTNNFSTELIGQELLEQMWSNWETWKSGVNE